MVYRRSLARKLSFKLHSMISIAGICPETAGIEGSRLQQWGPQLEFPKFLYKMKNRRNVS